MPHDRRTKPARQRRQVGPKPTAPATPAGSAGATLPGGTMATFGADLQLTEQGPAGDLLLTRHGVLGERPGLRVVAWRPGDLRCRLCQAPLPANQTEARQHARAHLG